MRRFQHPNILPLHTSFVAGSDLWMVLPFMGAGSVRHIMQQHFPQVGFGFECGVVLWGWGAFEEGRGSKGRVQVERERKRARRRGLHESTMLSTTTPPPPPACTP